MRAPHNRTLTCSASELEELSKDLLYLHSRRRPAAFVNRVINQDLWEAAQFLPKKFVDLLILDNLTKNYINYTSWFSEVLDMLAPTLKPTASVYVCSDWRTSTLIFPVLERYFHVRNRITWEPGRGANTNWKNNTEDIWFATCTDDYQFNQSNLWPNVSIPPWEDTDHPIQKPEKLIAKLILASSREDGMVFAPFLGSGTTAVVAKKLNRRFCGIELNREYCCWTLKRLQKAESDKRIQGYYIAS